MAAYRWLLDEGHDASRIVVAGDSAGGNLTLALLLRARDEGLPLPAGAVALSPVADLTYSGDSIQRNDGVDDMFSADMMDAMIPVYLAERRDLCTDPHVSPVFGDYSGMPPLLLIVGSSELLLDDSVRVAQRCPGAELLVWNGMPHVFPAFDFLPEAREATQRIGRFIHECLAGEAAAQAPGAEPRAPGLVARVPAASSARSHAPPRLDAEALLYLALAVVAGFVSIAVLAVWLGPALLWANPVVWAATAVVALFMFVEAGPVGWRRLSWCFAATLLLGPGCGLSLFLFLRASRRGRKRSG
jgi:hypothetical protein